MASSRRLGPFRGCRLSPFRSAWRLRFRTRGAVGSPLHRFDHLGDPFAELSPLLVIGVADQGIGGAFSTHPSRASDPVRQKLGAFGKFVVDHKFHVIDVESPSGHVGGHKNTHFAFAKVLHHTVSSVLAHVPLEASDRVSKLGELFREFAHTMFGPPEDDGGPVVGLIQQTSQGFHPIGFANFQGDMLDLRFALFGGSDGHFGRFVEILFAGFLNPLRHGRRKECGDVLAGQSLKDKLDIFGKPVVEHLISFIDHGVDNFVELDRFLSEQVDQTTGSGNQDMGTLLDRGDLRVDRTTAIDGERLDAVRLTEVVHHVSDLVGKLSRRSEHDSLDVLFLRVDELHHRQRESQGLAGAGASLSDHVLGVEKKGDRFFLNRSGCGDLARGKSLEALGEETEVGEFHKVRQLYHIASSGVSKKVAPGLMVTVGETSGRPPRPRW